MVYLFNPAESPTFVFRPTGGHFENIPANMSPTESEYNLKYFGHGLIGTVTIHFSLSQGYQRLAIVSFPPVHLSLVQRERHLFRKGKIKSGNCFRFNCPRGRKHTIGNKNFKGLRAASLFLLPQNYRNKPLVG